MENGKQPINPLPHNIDSSKVECVGLTKREYFAAMAMQGYCGTGDIGNKIPGHLATWAVDMADALLAELEKNN